MADYYSLISRAVANLEINTRDTRRAVYDRAKTAQLKQLNSIDTAFSDIEINREVRELEDAICKVEAEMSASSEARVSSDAMVILDYAAFMRETETRLDLFYDVKVLPHPKEVIVAAIEREIVSSPLDAHVDWLQKGAVLLWNFVEGVGPDPVPIAAGFARPTASRDAALADQADSADIGINAGHGENSEKTAIFMEIAAKEDEQIAERIAAAVRKRTIKRSQ